ncbi:hypothetical protein CK203_109580 [Vitis vinifera]|uniref:Uncharacterized protein n=1 Tax=Vitis vinifera TaxID=29760 RepID=A0A438FGR4_VITVI|nr:hypothetical protein CK203_109580 [Vitis vinifera]
MLDAKPCPTPMSSNTNLSLHDGVALKNDSDYRSFVGALQYWHISFWYLPTTFTGLQHHLLYRCNWPLALMTSVALVATTFFLAQIWFLVIFQTRSGIPVQHRIRVPRGSKWGCGNCLD